MRIAVLSGGGGWHVLDLVRAARQLGHAAEPVDFRTVAAAVGTHPGPLAGFDAALVRTMPAGSLEQVVFRMDVLHAAVAAGVRVLNPPRAVETCVDKYLTSTRLAAAGLPTPPTHVSQTADAALDGFDRLGGDVVVKPLFGSEGRGMVRLTDRETAWRTFHALDRTGQVIYQQGFVRHPGWDLRAFVVGGKVLAGMRRTARGDWRTNVAQGGTAEQVELGDGAVSLAVRAAAAVGCPLAGVDLLPGPGGDLSVIEVNAVPGWRALAAVTGRDVAADVVRFLTEEYR
ncbi:ATP-grasp domain-containing protein [Urbifossiella limnaea]|uniref:Alpha-aminoadipate--LysW ligase LysX n=1 Tax=Urbifossiella limnaea TaxID=2528023 RepID=A0A517XQV6_9BACT|nr:RimK family alpha-L-glutamate ligase [Urbifossiella limnaea]QDU19900.1 Alpha-aminoadipate--LysW ligase LysX [Urbifossiella limnaea]